MFWRIGYAQIKTKTKTNNLSIPNDCLFAQLPWNRPGYSTRFLLSTPKKGTVIRSQSARGVDFDQTSADPTWAANIAASSAEY